MTHPEQRTDTGPYEAAKITDEAVRQIARDIHAVQMEFERFFGLDKTATELEDHQPTFYMKQGTAYRGGTYPHVTRYAQYRYPIEPVEVFYISPSQPSWPASNGESGYLLKFRTKGLENTEKGAREYCMWLYKSNARGDIEIQGASVDYPSDYTDDFEEEYQVRAS